MFAQLSLLKGRRGPQTPERPLIRGGGFGSGFCAGQVRSAPGRLAVCFLAPKAAYWASFVQKQVPCLDFVTAGRISFGELSSGQCRQEGSPSPLARQGAARAWVRYTATTTVPGWLLVRSCKVGHMRGLIIYSQRSLFLLLPFYSVPTALALSREGYLRPRWSALCSDVFRSSVGA